MYMTTFLAIYIYNMNNIHAICIYKYTLKKSCEIDHLSARAVFYFDLCLTRNQTYVSAYIYIRYKNPNRKITFSDKFLRLHT